MDTLISFQNDIDRILDDDVFVHNAMLDNIDPSFLSISTITLACNLQNIKLPISMENIRNQYPEKENSIKDLIGESATFEKTSTSFLNCVIFKYNPNGQKKNNKSIKIFSNGLLHITGVKSGTDAIDLSQQLGEIFKIILEQDIVMDSYKIQMINTNFSLNKPINLMALQDMLQSKNIACNYNREKYHGLKIKSPSVTTLVFVTGNIIITGSKTAKDTFDAYASITSIMNDNLATLELLNYVRKRKLPGDPCAKRGRKKKCVTDEFYDNLQL